MIAVTTATLSFSNRLKQSALCAVFCFATLIVVCLFVAPEINIAVKLSPLFVAASVVTGLLIFPWPRLQGHLAAFLGVVGGAISALLFLASVSI